MTAPIKLPPPPPARVTAQSGRSRRRASAGVAGIVAALALSGTALGFALTTPSGTNTQQQTVAPIPAESGGPVAGPADRALCEAITPLVKENDSIVNAFAGLGDRGSPPRDAGIPGFQASIRDWVSRVEPVLNAHPEASDYLARNLQRYIDDNRIYAANLKRGPGVPADVAAWDDATVAIRAGSDVCRTQLGVAGWQ
ncbi:MAG: hypothetical protein WA988_07450 [Candidatus Nanopelagicales bacterium]